jgi:formate-dependent nitrite reductase membrane component NrfD
MSMFLILLAPSVLFTISCIHYTQTFTYDYFENQLYLDDLLGLFCLFAVLILTIFLIWNKKVKKWITKSFIHKIFASFILSFWIVLAYFSGIIVLIWKNVPLWQ